MRELIDAFPEQMLKALEIGEQATFQSQFKNRIRNIVICGLGGSGIGGDLFSELLKSELKVPVIVNKGYFLPAFVDETTLLILSSYSGNTEETLSIANQAIALGLNAVCITSGGKLLQLAKQHNWDSIIIPAGFPPRSCLGYSATQLFFVAAHFNLLNSDFKSSIKDSAAFLKSEKENIIADSEFLAAKLLQKVIIVYTEDKYESTALRLKQQINENSKMHCWYNVIPEMNHNEIVGWKEAHGNIAVLIFRSDDEFHRNTHRILYKKDVVAKLSENVFEISAKGNNFYEKHFYFIHFGDWLSYHLAVLKGIDPVEVNVITKLKNSLDAI